MLQTKIEEQSKITLPPEIVSKLKLITGDVLNVEVNNGKIILLPNEEDKEFDTPEIQQSIDRGLKDIEEGKTNGPFSNADDLIQSLNS